MEGTQKRLPLPHKLPLDPPGRKGGRAAVSQLQLLPHQQQRLLTRSFRQEGYPIPESQKPGFSSTSASHTQKGLGQGEWLASGS